MLKFKMFFVKKIKLYILMVSYTKRVMGMWIGDSLIRKWFDLLKIYNVE